MRNIGIVFTLIVFIFAANCYAGDLPFEKGEKLTYEVRYKGAAIGESVLSFQGEVNLGDKNVYYVTFSTKVPSFRDIEELYADRDTFLPAEVHRSIKKTIGFNDRIIERYDQKDFRVDISSKSKLRTKNFSIQKDSPLHNAILLIYFYRTQEEFKEGDVFKITLPTLDFKVVYTGIETIETPLGRYRTYAFKSDPPEFELWLSADERRLPLKIKTPGLLGYSLVINAIDWK